MERNVGLLFKMIFSEPFILKKKNLRQLWDKNYLKKYTFFKKVWKSLWKILIFHYVNNNNSSKSSLKNPKTIVKCHFFSNDISFFFFHN